MSFKKNSSKSKLTETNQILVNILNCWSIIYLTFILMKSFKQIHTIITPHSQFTIFFISQKMYLIFFVLSILPWVCIVMMRNKQYIDSQGYSEICIYCIQNFPVSELEKHTKLCFEEFKKLFQQPSPDHIKKGSIVFKQCRYCQIKLQLDRYQQHKKQCEARKYKVQIKQKGYKGNLQSCSENSKKQQINKIAQKEKQDTDYPDYYKCNICYWCDSSIPSDHLQDHKYFCQNKLRLSQDLLIYNLSPNQFHTLFRMYKKSAYSHSQAKSRVLTRIKSKGYSQQELFLMGQFIEHQAPIIIHTNLSKSIKHFITDGEYRSLFQTHTSGGAPSQQKRKLWESYLFGKEYNNCLPTERIKYAVINYSNDKYGTMKCRGYGESIIVLKNSVRKRCTIAHNRKYAQGEIVATLTYNYPVLEKFRDEELKVLSLASRGFQVESNNLSHFKEIHVHGRISFAQHVECIYTSKLELAMLITDATYFHKKFGVKIIALQDLQKAYS